MQQTFALAALVSSGLKHRQFTGNEGLTQGARIGIAKTRQDR